ncbi:MAG: S8 family serine peptidase [Candidatus Aminicenantes bacterium]|nr:MAG: S8 family serine peptidase [Candidatus Aminicenantes bacterium]
MKKKCIFTRFFWVVFAFLATLIIILPEKATLQATRSALSNSFPMDAYYREGNPKMESVLYQLMQAYYLQGLEAAQGFAQLRGIDMEDDFVRIVAEAQYQRAETQSQRSRRDIGVMGYPRELWWKFQYKQRNVSQRSPSNLVSMRIRTYGGRVETTYRNLVQSVVPLYALQDLAHYSSVKYLRLPKKPVPFVISEGVEKTGADLWQNVIPYRSGENVKVCILDLGFSGYQALQGTELPSSVTARSFRSDGDLFVSDHGTACAEIVYDMAPDAELLLVNFGTDIEHRNAVNWLIDQDVDIISCSVGWFNIGAGDGTGPICEDVKNAHDNGIIWVSAAGNTANTHWEGSFRDPDLDFRCNFEDPGDPEYEYYGFNVVAGNEYSVFLSWDDWGSWNGFNYIGSEGNDYDLFLYDSGFFVLASSNNDQTAGAPPTETISFIATETGVQYIRVIEWVTIRDCHLELFFHNIDSLDSQYYELSGSLAIPADSPYAVSVGATYWADDSYESYSSQGPTNDGRVKPDFCAPAGVLSSTYGPAGFFGTSAATPHVSGAIALLKEKMPYTLDEIKGILEARAEDLGSAGKDNIFGHGRLSLVEGAGGENQIRRIQVIDERAVVSQGKRKISETKIRIKKKGPDKEKYIIK